MNQQVCTLRSICTMTVFLWANSAGWAAVLNVPADYPTIQEAINAAVDGDEVVLADGTYTGVGNRDIDFDGKAITVRSASGDPALCVIDCQDAGRGFKFDSGEGPDSVLAGLTITNGRDTAGGGGSGVYCRYSSPTLTNCIIRGNASGHNGAGAYFNSSSPTLTDCIISDNFCGLYGGGNGGGVYCYSSSPTLTNCIISGNTAINGAGGFACVDGGSPTLTNCTISGNVTGDYGGGVYCSSSSPTLTNCTIRGNSAAALGFGGGVYCASSSPTLTNCTITANSANNDGGGFYSNYSSNAILTDCTLSANSAYRGGGAYSRDSSPRLTRCIMIANSANYGGGVYSHYSGSPTLTNCTISGNVANVNGGGVTSEYYTNLLTLANCIISGNGARQRGGGVYCSYGGSPTLTNCTIGGNAAGTRGGGVYIGPSCSPTLTNCILWGDAPREVDGSVNYANISFCCVQGGWDGSDNIASDPLFVRPPSDGGDGWGDNPNTPGVDEGANDDFGDLRLQPGSPCIDAGDNAAVPADTVDLDGDGDVTEPLPFDLTDQPRFVDDPFMKDFGVGSQPIVDIGTYERQFQSRERELDAYNWSDAFSPRLDLDTADPALP